MAVLVCLPIGISAVCAGVVQGQSDLYPVMEDYARDERQDQFVKDAVRFLQDYEGSRFAPKVAMDLLILGEVKKSQQLIEEMRDFLILKHPESVHARYAATTFRSGEAYGLMMSRNLTTQMADIELYEAQRAIQAFEIGQSIFGSSVVRDPALGMKLALIAAKIEDYEFQEDLIKQMRDVQHPTHKAVLIALFGEEGEFVSANPPDRALEENAADNDQQNSDSSDDADGEISEEDELLLTPEQRALRAMQAEAEAKVEESPEVTIGPNVKPVTQAIRDLVPYLDRPYVRSIQTYLYNMLNDEDRLSVHMRLALIPNYLSDGNFLLAARLFQGIGNLPRDQEPQALYWNALSDAVRGRRRFAQNGVQQLMDFHVQSPYYSAARELGEAVEQYEANRLKHIEIIRDTAEQFFEEGLIKKVEALAKWEIDDRDYESPANSTETVYLYTNNDDENNYELSARIDDDLQFRVRVQDGQAWMWVKGDKVITRFKEAKTYPALVFRTERNEDGVIVFSPTMLIADINMNLVTLAKQVAISPFLKTDAGLESFIARVVQAGNFPTGVFTIGGTTTFGYIVPPILDSEIDSARVSIRNNIEVRNAPYRKVTFDRVKIGPDFEFEPDIKSWPNFPMYERESFTDFDIQRLVKVLNELPQSDFR